MFRGVNQIQIKRHQTTARHAHDTTDTHPSMFFVLFLMETKQPKDGSFCSTFQIDAGRSKQPKQKKSLSLVDTERELDSTDRTEHIDTLNKSS